MRTTYNDTSSGITSQGQLESFDISPWANWKVVNGSKYSGDRTEGVFTTLPSGAKRTNIQEISTGATTTYRITAAQEGRPKTKFVWEGGKEEVAAILSVAESTSDEKLIQSAIIIRAATSELDYFGDRFRTREESLISTDNNTSRMVHWYVDNKRETGGLSLKELEEKAKKDQIASDVLNKVLDFKPISSVVTSADGKTSRYWETAPIEDKRTGKRSFYLWDVDEKGKLGDRHWVDMGRLVSWAHSERDDTRAQDWQRLIDDIKEKTAPSTQGYTKQTLPLMMMGRQNTIRLLYHLSFVLK
ncbi:uncharacterized protein L201_002302 [Kwoniella dendrophila CBS 6074]|uniref:Uncharacterized protein n=1 Tax=Kwoniella dendrophila CBS 6074 TaxID=1295534 RepID=A0AAX4JR72_9TREE